MWKKSLQSGDFREGQSGNSKHNFFLIYFALVAIATKAQSWAKAIKNIMFVETNVNNIPAKFQLYPPYGFRGDDFWNFFGKFSFSVAIKFSSSDKIHMLVEYYTRNISVKLL